MKTDMSSEIKVAPSTAPAAAVTGNGTTTGATIDTQGYEALTFVVSTGVVTDGTFAGTVYGSNDSGMSGEVALSGSQVSGGATAAGASPHIAIATTDDGVCERVGVNIQAAGYRYYRLKLVQAGATSGGFVSAQAILGKPKYAPTATP